MNCKYTVTLPENNSDHQGLSIKWVNQWEYRPANIQFQKHFMILEYNKKKKNIKIQW